MYKELKQLKSNILFLYVFAGFGILLFCMLQTIFVTHAAWTMIIKFQFPSQFFLATLVTVINSVYTQKKLYSSLSNAKPFDLLSNDSKEKLYKLIMEFPQKLFWMSIILYPGFILIKYIYELIFVIHFSVNHMLYIFLKFISSSSILFMYSLTITIFLRNYLKPLLFQFNKKTLEPLGALTFKKSISMSGIVLFLLYFVNILVFAYFGGNSRNFIWSLLLLTAEHSIVFIWFLRNVIFDHVDNLRTISTELINIQMYDRSKLHKPIPITTSDEIGLLTSSYNKIQHKIRSVYEEIDEHLSFAKRVHNSLISELYFHNDFIELKALSSPAKDIGGDFYDCFQVNSKKYVILIGDVLGKGLPAALLMSMIIGHFRASTQTTFTLKELAVDLNAALYPICQNGLFVTCGIGIVDLEQSVFSYVSAGHLPPLIIDDTNSSYLESSSFPLGVSKKIKINEIHVPLTNIRQLVLYTDGIIEQVNAQGAQFGFSRFQNLVSSNPDPKNILKHLHEYACQAEILDDMSVLIINIANTES